MGEPDVEFEPGGLHHGYAASLRKLRIAFLFSAIQREGVAKAKAGGKYKGRAPTARAKFQTVAKIAPETKRYALATLQLQFSSVPAARSSEHAAVGSLPIA